MKLTDADNAADGIFFPALEQNMMGAVLINENDEVMFFNPAAEKLWGYKREEVIGNNIDMLIPRDLRPAHPEYIRHNREGGKARVEGMSRELLLEKKDGSKSRPTGDCPRSGTPYCAVQSRIYRNVWLLH